LAGEVKPDWYHWTLKRWNDVLVDLVFGKRTDASSEIVRIDATNRLLVAAANGNPENADAIRQSFLDSFPSTRSGLATLFDASTQTRKWYPEDIDLPFFAQLYLTILVASADEETFTIGNFRNRFQVLLGVDVSVGHLLHDLPKLWKGAALWTRDTRREDVRRLILPSPEHEVIIGHSKRLAFPGFEDQTKLAKLLAEHELDATSPENQIVNIIGRRRHSFSKWFGEEFDSFLRLIQRGDRPSAVRSPFWGAIVEINWDARTNKARQKASEFELELDPNDPYTASLMLVARGAGSLVKPWAYKKLAFNAGEMECEVVSNASPKEPLLPLLESASGQKLLAGTPICDWVARGWIGFCRDDLERWVGARDLSKSNDIWLLVRSDRWGRVARALITAGRQPDYELEGVLSDKWTLAGPLRNNPGLRDVLQDALGDRDSFATRLSSPRIRFVETIRLPEGILLVPPCLPMATIDGATKISWSIKRAADATQQWLLQDPSRSDLFGFNRDDISNLPPMGEIEFRAYNGDDEEMDRTSFFFVNGCVSHDLKRPDDLASFLKVGDLGQLAPADEVELRVDVPRRDGIEETVFPIVYEDHERVTASSITIDEIPADWHACLEILTGKFKRRNSIPAGEFFDTVARIWNLGPTATWMRIGIGNQSQLKLRSIKSSSCRTWVPMD
jgi:hypothetical protein